MIEDTGVGAVAVTGVGGMGDDANRGVFVVGTDAAIRSADGDLAVEGTGGSNGQAGSVRNGGVHVENGGAIEAAGAGAVRVVGVGGDGEDFNTGVEVFGTNAAIRAAGGGVTVTGTGGSNGTAVSSINAGVYLVDGGAIEDAGLGAVSVTGTGGAGGDSNFGVYAVFRSAIRSTGGGVTVEGTGGSNGLGGNDFNYGVHLIQSTIEDAGAGDVRITGRAVGTGDIPGTDRQDVLIDGGEVRSVTGTITVTGLQNDVEMINRGGVFSDSGNAILRAADDVLLGVVNLDADDAGAAGTAIVTADFNTASVDAVNGTTADGTVRSSTVWTAKMSTSPLRPSSSARRPGSGRTRRSTRTTPPAPSGRTPRTSTSPWGASPSSSPATGT